MNYQWYPGHMTKAKRQMQEDIKLIDLVIELVDARIPLSSRNPDIDDLGKNKARLILLNKADLADEKKNKLWKACFQKQGFFVVELDARKRNSMKLIQDTILESCKEKIERDRRRGIKNRPIRAMVVGIPNVGKSTFINTFAGKAAAKTGNRPGVTKGKQWIRLNKNVELLDTPGILWPKFDDQAVGMRLAWIGSMNDSILNIDELSLDLIAYLTENYPGALAERYRIQKTGESTDVSQEKEEDAAQRNQAASDEKGLKPVEILEQIAKSRNCIRSGGEIDYSKAAVLLLDDFRSGRLGRLTMESPAIYDTNGFDS
ncbi:MAG: ribosome biogenesis GTPase YlqF [Clostridiales bacterium]|nr:ribosome biogenesis GTPase YlqF [Clostridiales bacterium]